MEKVFASLFSRSLSYVMTFDNLTVISENDNVLHLSVDFTVLSKEEREKRKKNPYSLHNMFQENNVQNNK